MSASGMANVRCVIGAWWESGSAAWCETPARDGPFFALPITLRPLRTRLKARFSLVFVLLFFFFFFDFFFW